MSRMSEFRRFCAGPILWALTGLLLQGSGASAADAEGWQSLSSIRAAAEKSVRSRMPANGRGILVTAGELDPRLRLPRCSGPLRATATFGSQVQARMAVGVGCSHGSTWTVFVPVTVESEIPLLVLRVPAVAGTRLAAGDVTQETRRVAGLAVGYINDAAVLAHNTLKRPLAAGSVLTADALVPDVVVRQGEEVTLLAGAGGIEVRASGRALANGRDGERIRVQNLGSLKVVEGVVDSSRVIHVTP
jgi:flagellar basal body P-ring formation protein FlgA